MRLRSLFVPALAAALFGVALSAGARGREPAEVNPIVPSLQLNRVSLPRGSVLELTYSWAIEPEARKLDRDYLAFVHFLDARGVILFTDDHRPEPAPPRWDPGHTYAYQRTVFVPVAASVGRVEVRMGLYDLAGRTRPALKGEHRGLHEYKVATLELLSETENIAVVHKEGWHDPERRPEHPGLERRWTKREALVSFRNPKRGVIVYLEGDTCVACFDRQPELTVTIGTVGRRFTIERPEASLRKIRFRARDLGAEDWVELKLSMDASFVPRDRASPPSEDGRELGFDVYHLCVVEARTVGPAADVVDAVPLAPPRE